MSGATGAQYIEGSTATFRARLLDIDGNPVDPSNVRMLVLAPDATESYLATTSLDGGSIIGTVHLTRHGTWRYRFESTIEPYAVFEEYFSVQKRGVPPLPGPGGSAPTLATNWRIGELPATSPLQLTDQIAVSRGAPATTYRGTVGDIVSLVQTQNVSDVYITPEQFGAIGDGESHPAFEVLGVDTLEELQEWNNGMYAFADSIGNEMDWLGLQAALRAGGEVRGTPGAVYVANKTIAVWNGHVQWDGRGCVWSFQGQEEVLDDGSNLVTNPSFNSGATGWQNTILAPRVDVVFAGGKATFTDPPVTFTPGESHFGQFGQQMTIPPGKWTVRARVKLSEGASQGYWGARLLGMGFFKDGPGLGGWAWPDPLYAISSAGATVASPFDGWMEFDIEAPEEVTAWLTFSGFNCDWEVQEVRLSPFLMNFSVWCSGDFVSGRQYDETELRNFKIVGPAQRDWWGDERYGFQNPEFAGPFISGFLHKSFAGESARANLVNVHIREFFRGVHFSDQAFLIRHTAVTIGACGECVYFQPAVRNAGENLRFTDCILFNSGVAVHAAGGAEWNFVGTSIDFCRVLVRGRKGAVLNFTNHHFEFNASETRIWFSTVDSPLGWNRTITGGTSGATAKVLISDRQGNPWAERTPSVVVEVLSGTFLHGETVTDGVGGSAVVDGGVAWGEPLVDLDGGSYMIMPSGEWLQSGAGHRGGLHAVRVNTTQDTVAFGDVWAYNLLTASGDWGVGAGRIVFNNHLGPGNSLFPMMLLRNQQMDAFAGNGGIAGTGTWEDQGFSGPEDEIGIDFSAHSPGGAEAPSSRGLIPWEQEVRVDRAVFRTAGNASLALDINEVYTGGTELRVFIPVRAGKIVLPEFWFSKPEVKANRTHGPFTSGLPLAGDTIYVNISEGKTLAIIEDKHVQWLGGNGPRPGWSVTLASVTGNPGGVANAVWNATHAVVERLDAFRFTIDLGVGNAATSTVANAGGAAVEATYTQTNVLIYVRNFWVRRTWTDSYGRPVLSQALYQGEKNITINHAAHPWEIWNYATWYSEAVVPDTPNERVARGRAPEWATHYMLVLNWQNIRECDPVACPNLYLTDFYANVV